MTVTEPQLNVDPEPQSIAAAQAGREYVVLQLMDAGEYQWGQLGSFSAISTDEAIRKAAAVQAADPDVDTSGVLTYVAVPVRSFQPVEVTAKVEPKIEFRGR